MRGLTARGHHIEAWCPPIANQTYLPLSELIPEHVVPLALPASTDWDKRLRVPPRIERRLAAMDRHCRLCADAISLGGFDTLLAHPCMFFRATPIGRFVWSPKVLYQQEPYRVLLGFTASWHDRPVRGC